MIDTAREILDDPRFLQQKGVRSIVDKDARVGYKTKTESFFGYKVEYAMIAKERIITAVNAYDGAYVNGTEYEALYNRTKECGIKITKAYGDKAYFRQLIIEFLEEEKVDIYIPVSQSVYKMVKPIYIQQRFRSMVLHDGKLYGKKEKYQEKETRRRIQFSAVLL